MRYGMLLDQAGRASEAKVVFAEVLAQMKRAPKYVRKVQAGWLSIAEKRLAAWAREAEGVGVTPKLAVVEYEAPAILAPGSRPPASASSPA